MVPRVVVSGGKGDGEGGSSIMEALLTMLFSDRFGAMEQEAEQAPYSPEAEALREQIRKNMLNKSS